MADLRRMLRKAPARWAMVTFGGMASGLIAAALVGLGIAEGPAALIGLAAIALAVASLAWHDARVGGPGATGEGRGEGEMEREEG